MFGKRDSSPTNVTAESTAQWSNAERIARGLPPRKPGTLYSPTRVARQAPSNVPVQTTGVIQIRQASDDSEIGYISRTLSTGRVRLTSGVGDAFQIKFTPPTSGQAFEIEIDDNISWRYLGVQGVALSGPSSTTVNGFVRTNSVTYGPSRVVGHSAGSGSTQSHLWFYNSATRELTAQWINPDNGVLPAYFYVSNGPGLRFLYLTSNPSLTSSSGVTRIKLYVPA